MKKVIIYILPVIVFAACSTAQNQEKKDEKKESAPAYATATVEQGGISSTVKLPAQLAAYQEVSIFPKVNGYVKNVLVDIGSKVKQGQLLMTLEAPELIDASLQAKENYAKSKSGFAIDKENYMRLLEASRTAGAISPLDLSTARAKMEADSSLCNAEKANWQRQEQMLAYLNVTAPFTGIITERNVHPGALVSAAEKNTAMLELKQVEHLRLQVSVPELFSTQMKIGDTISFYVNALNGKKLTGKIVRRASDVNTQYRTEKVEIDVVNKEAVLAPGMYADVLLRANGSLQAFKVPRSAVVTSTERKYVLVLKNNAISKVDVTTGNQSADSEEVFGNLQNGDVVIINASDEIPEGAVAGK
ncbi:efflux RND transporter periplasmic adaptor subunit [Chitinophagaceae bacterium 26-R-25]|nr:efflux RND transporter periplasmic adaptor subunit [Chitinophagaceae bacterium 26-R-25]